MDMSDPGIQRPCLQMFYLLKKSAVRIIILP